MSASNIGLVYSPDLDFHLPDFAALGGSEQQGTSNVHIFDGARASRAFGRFLEHNPGAVYSRIEPLGATDSELRLALDPDYLATLEHPQMGPPLIAKIIDVPAAAQAPLDVLTEILLVPKRLATGGTLAAMRFVLSEERRSQAPIAINLGGGYHHGHPGHGEGFCVYNDIAVAAAAAEVEFDAKRVLCIDVDAHQGNGTAMCFRGNPGRALLDLYNKDIWPGDEAAIHGTRWPIALADGTGGEQYLATLNSSLAVAFKEFEPDFILYNAGTDSISGDPLGNLSLTLADIRERDALVLDTATRHGVPLVAVPSGGYTDQSHIALAGLLEVATGPRKI